MKIAFDVMKISGFSGNQVYTTELILALSKYFPENQYQLITHCHTLKGVKNVFRDSKSLVYRNILPGHLILGKSFKSAISSLNQNIQKWISSSFDLYHCTNPMRFPEKLNNVVVTLHDLIALKDEPWTSEGSKRFYKNHIRKILEKSKAILTVSHYTKQEAINYFPDIEHKIFVTPLAANPEFACIDSNTSFLKSYDIQDNTKPFVLYIGEIQARKNIFRILKAYDSLPLTIRKNFDFVVIGRARYKSNQEEFEKFLNGLTSKSQIHHLSNIPFTDLIRFYNQAYAFIYVSLFEGFGLPVIEAMQCGCPVLTSNTTSLAEVAGNAAITVDPNDQNAIEEGLLKLLDDSVLRDKLKQRGLEHAKTFSWEKTAQLTMQGYKMAVS